MNWLPDTWITAEEAAQAVHAPLSLIERWVREGKVATRSDTATQALLVSAADVEGTAEEEAFRLLSHKALANEERD